MSADEVYDKALGQFRFSLYTLLDPLRRYGQKEYCDQLVEELVSLGVQLHYRLCGEDMPYTVRRPSYN